MAKKKIDFPKMKEITKENVADYMTDLYRTIGWDGKCEVNPTQICINKSRWGEICKAYSETEVSGAGLVWMNWGPTADEEVPYGKIIINSGAFLKEEKRNAIKN